jgi:putative heme-binding domain-containing protein
MEPILAQAPALSSKDKLVVETVLRLKTFDLNASAPAKAAILRYLQSEVGSDQYFELIERFKPVEIVDSLLSYSLEHASTTQGVRGAGLLFAMNQQEKLQAVIGGEDESKAIAAINLIGHAGGGQVVPMLQPLLVDAKSTVGVKAAAIASMGRRPDGQKQILALVSDGKLFEELKFAAANVLLSSEDPAIVEEAEKHLQLPATADAQPLPPLAELSQRKGDPEAGKIVYQTVGTCINCHKVQNEGKEVGPNLSEIGSKLSREAMFVAILDPSAAISHNFETYSLVTIDGNVINGLLISETDASVTLRTNEGIDKKVDQDSIELLKKQPKSIMPQDLQRLMTVNQLVDLVEYLMTLRSTGAVPQPTTK